MPTRLTRAAGSPRPSDRGTDAASATTAAIPTARRVTRPDAMGLSALATAMSRSASIQSLLQPIDSWPANMAAPTRTMRGPSRPIPAARTTVTSVTAVAGPGCDARTRAQIIIRSIGTPLAPVGLVLPVRPGVFDARQHASQRFDHGRPLPRFDPGEKLAFGVELNGQDLVDERNARGRERDEHASPVARIGRPNDQPPAREGLEPFRRRRARRERDGAQGARGLRPARAAKGRQNIEFAPAEPMAGQHLVAALHDQRCTAENAADDGDSVEIQLWAHAAPLMLNLIYRVVRAHFSPPTYVVVY
ncbi:protein of unknown function [Agreia sp. COWG]|nr:protein of unknown function [Agreia sp. COWG]